MSGQGTAYSTISFKNSYTNSDTYSCMSIGTCHSLFPFIPFYFILFTCIIKKNKTSGTSLVVQCSDLSCNIGNTGSVPSGKIPHPAEQLSPCTTTTEPTCLKAHDSRQEKPLQWEAHALQLERPWLAVTSASLCTAMRTQHSQK